MPRLSSADGWSEMTPAISPEDVLGTLASWLATTRPFWTTRVATVPGLSRVTYVRTCLVAPVARLIGVW